MFLRLGAHGRTLPGLETILLRRDDRAIAFPDDIVNRRKADRGVGMRVVCDPLEDALMDFGPFDLDFILFQLFGLPIEMRDQLARPVAIIAAKTLARIVQPSVLVLPRDRILEGVGIGDHEIGIRRIACIVRLEFEPATFGLGNHPDEGDVGQRIVGITAADIGMHA